ncbi:MAG TPA: hypothetical protein VHL80_19030 [Polyangia bacterium]|nr:hypothetical protein [Polyangia bacterium]
MEGNPNILAWIALVLCVPVSMFMIARWRAAVSVPLVIVGGQMFLPSNLGWEVPHLMYVNKDVLVPLGALLGCYFFRRSSIARARPFRGYDLFLVLRLVTLLGSCMTNQEALVFPKGTVPGLSFASYVGNALAIFLYWWPTIFLGRTVIKTSRDLKTLFVIFAGAATVYTFFVLIELRMSPQLNMWIYGYRQTPFVMTLRAGGFRPMAFMRHGLNLAFFLSVCVCAATALGRVKGRVFGIKARYIALYLMVVLIFDHSLGALLYAALGMPLIWVASARTQTRVAAVLALLAFCYPLARATGLVPVKEINAFVLEKFGQDRAGSLGLRLNEEEYIMTRTLERPWFGWGPGGRSFRLDPVTGENRSVTDGLWALVFGSDGVLGYALYFGMLFYPVWRSRRALKQLPTKQDQTFVAALAVIGAIYIVELIPNSSIDPYITFLTAVLAGVVGRGLQPDEDAVPAPSEARDDWPAEAPRRYA